MTAESDRAPKGDVLDLSILPLRQKPFSHVVADNFVRDDVYRALAESFPDISDASNPIEGSCFWGTETYDRLMETNWAWKALFEAVQSQLFVDYAIAQFRDVFGPSGCTMDLAAARYERYRETDEQKQEPRPAIDLPPNLLWVRLDLRQGHIGYHKNRHVDWRRRLVSMLIYLCDTKENQMRGGDLILHPKFLPALNPYTTTVSPRHNRMVAFACGAESLHSVSRVRRQRGPRNFIQILVSSSRDAWVG